MNFLSRFASNPTIEQYSLLKRVVIYAKTTATRGITYRYDAEIHNKDNLGLLVHSDASYGDNTDRKSSAGYMVQLLGGVVSFKAYRQRIVTSSSTEAEFVALTYAAKEAAWVRRLLQQIGYCGTDVKPTKVFSDNQPAIHLVLGDGHHERTKHIDTAYKYVREEYRNGNISMQHLPGIEMPADGLTKPLDRFKHAKFIQLTNLQDIPRASGKQANC